MTQDQEFAEAVRALYLRTYGDEGLGASGQPVDLGTVLVMIQCTYLDGEESSIMIYDGSRITALGLAREGVYACLPD